MSSTPRPDKTLYFKQPSLGQKSWFHFSDGTIPVIELEYERIRIGCWYVSLDAFEELNKQWMDFRNGKSKLRIQG